MRESQMLKKPSSRNRMKLCGQAYRWHAVAEGCILICGIAFCFSLKTESYTFYTFRFLKKTRLKKKKKKKNSLLHICPCGVHYTVLHMGNLSHIGLDCWEYAVKTV